MEDSCVTMIRHLLDDPPEVHVEEVEQERWELELGDRVAIRLAPPNQNFIHWWLMNASTLYYHADPLFRAAVDGEL
jgi:hypothetical protein